MEQEKELDDMGMKFSSPAAKKEVIDKKLHKYVTQQMQNFVFGLNVPSRRGTQTPFTNITHALRDREMILLQEIQRTRRRDEIAQ